jgi:hypothetical protein
MASRNDERPRQDQGKRNTEIRRDTDVRGSMGTPPSGRESSDQSQPSREEVRGSESNRPPRQPGRMPLPD